MDNNIQYRRILRRAESLLLSAINILPDLTLLNRKIRRYNIEKEHLERMLTMKAIVPTENLIKFLHLQQAIFDAQKAYDSKIEEISTAIITVLLYTLQTMSKSLKKGSSINDENKTTTKTLFYKCIEIIENETFKGKINLDSIIPLIIEFDFQITIPKDVNEKNIRNRIQRLKSIIYSDKE